ncbi:hypothetical protein D3C86_2030710 [compost metagenome]
MWGFDKFDQLAVWRHTTYAHTAFCNIVNKYAIHLVAMAVALNDIMRTIQLGNL